MVPNFSGVRLFSLFQRIAGVSTRHFRPEETPTPPTEDPQQSEQPELGADNTYDIGSTYNPYDMFNFVP